MTPAEFCDLMVHHLSPCTVMLAIAQGPPGAQRIVDNGTGTLLNTRRAEFLVTSAHVHDGFLRYLDCDPTTRLLMSGDNGKPFEDISAAHVIGKDPGIDLVTLDVCYPQVRPLGKMHFVVSEWPPPVAEKGMSGYLLGYPGLGRTMMNDIVGVPSLALAMPIVSSSDRHFILCDETGDIVRSIPNGAPPLSHLGGISGAAVYVRTTTPDGTESMFLGGFEYEAGGDDLVFVAHAKHLNADGTIG
jgi:hypothetical protein